jgi:hypothetical protein
MKNGIDFPKVEAALNITADAIGDPNEIIFIVPLNGDILLLGGKFTSHIHHPGSIIHCWACRLTFVRGIAQFH